MTSQERCSAQNGRGDFCSTFDFFGNNQHVDCSAFAAGAVCSTLPPIDPLQTLSLCSAGNAGDEPTANCSAFGNGNNVRCSVKGEGTGFCSTARFTNVPGEYHCSVFNQGATQRSFCSTKFNQPRIAKGCSTFPGSDGVEQCSIVQGGRGICTTFGAADPNSCSAFALNSHCSVIGGAPGNFCVQ